MVKSTDISMNEYIICPFKERGKWYWLDSHNQKQPFSPSGVTSMSLIGRCMLPEELIQAAFELKGIKSDSESFCIRFSEDPFLLADAMIRYEKDLYGGYLFDVLEFGSPPAIKIPRNVKVWFCDVFDQYFKKVPKDIYIRFTQSDERSISS